MRMDSPKSRNVWMAITPRNRSLLRNRSPQKHPHTFPGTTTQFREKWTIIKKIISKDLGDAEDKMTMRAPFQSLCVPRIGTINLIGPFKEFEMSWAQR
jgi:hypothetical protein